MSCFQVAYQLALVAHAIIQAFRRLRQKDQVMHASRGYIA